MAAASALLDDMMNLEVPRRAATRCHATMMIARKHLLAEPRCHGARRSLRRGCVERAEDLGITCRPLEHFRADIDLSPRAVLRGAPAIRALLIGDLVRRTLGAGPR